MVKRALAARRERKTQDAERLSYHREGDQAGRKIFERTLLLSAFESDCVYMKASRDIKAKGRQLH